MKDDSDSEKRQQIHHIKNLYAFNLFCQKRFDDSMQVFAKLGTGNLVWAGIEEFWKGEATVSLSGFDLEWRGGRKPPLSLTW